MKKLFLLLASSFLLFSCGNKEDLSVKTEKVSGSTLKSTFKVWGNCETCKDAIENSLRADGITEANNSSFDEYGAARLYAHVSKPSGSVQSLLNDVNTFASGFPATDDITIVLVQARE